MEFYKDSHGTDSFIQYRVCPCLDQPRHYYGSHVVGLVLAVAFFSSAHSFSFVVGIRTFNSYFQYFFRIKFYKGIHF